MKQDDFAKFTELVKQREQLDLELKKFQHKLTVCFVDIVGSTSYFEEHGDVKGMVWVHECIETLSRVATEHGGTICKTIGDAVMTSYDDPVKAVQASIEMQKAIEAHNQSCAPDMKIKVRIGLNYGDGLVKEKDVFGDVVNVAARIESAAKADQIFISADLEKMVKAANLPTQKLPDLTAKGKAERVSIYEVLWMRDKSGKPISAVRLPSPTMAGRTPVTEAVKPPSGTVVLSAAAIADLLAKPTLQYSLVIVRPDGTHGQSFKLDKQANTLGRVEGDIVFPDDNLVSRRHARLTIANEGLIVEDLNSANGVYWRLRKSHPLESGDVILMGRQMFRFRSPTADSGDAKGKDAKSKPPDSKPSQPELVRILPGGIEENHYPLPPGESVLGRTRGTINFPEDAYLSSTHARVRNDNGKCILEDMQAVNGTFIGVRKSATLTDGDILLIGHQLLRVTSTAS